MQEKYSVLIPVGIDERGNMTIQEAIKKIESNTCFRMTAMCNNGSAFFVPTGNDGKTVIGGVFEMSKAKILKLASIEKPANLK